MSEQTYHEMSDIGIRMLAGAMLDYLCQMKSDDSNTDSRKVVRHTEILTDFLIYAIREQIAWKDMFTFDTFIGFRKSTGVKKAGRALIGLSGYLHDKGRIRTPLKIPNYQIQLPDIYEQYLRYLEQARAVSNGSIKGARRVLASLHDYLEAGRTDLCALEIEQLDLYMATFKVAPNTRRVYLQHLKGFLRYLRYEKKVLRKDLASLLVASHRTVHNSSQSFGSAFSTAGNENATVSKACGGSDLCKPGIPSSQILVLVTPICGGRPHHGGRPGICRFLIYMVTF